MEGGASEPEPATVSFEVAQRTYEIGVAWRPVRVDRDEILRVLPAFEAAGLEYVLIGATAMGFHEVVRATEDLNPFIRATAENVARLRAALKATSVDDPRMPVQKFRSIEDMRHPDR